MPGPLLLELSPAPPQLRPAPEMTEERGFDVPQSVEAAEEASLIWKWMERTRLRLVDATGTLSLPSRPVVRLGGHHSK